MKIIIVGCGAIGTHVAVSLLKTGHDVFCISRHVSDNPLLNKDLYFDADVTSKDQLAGARDYVTDFLGAGWEHADALIYTAGMQGQICKATDINPEEFLRTFDVNVAGFLRSWQTFECLLRKSRRAKVIMFSGGGADGPRKYLLGYASSKAASVRLAETLAAEVADYCDLNIVAPGMILSRMTEEVVAAGQWTGQNEYGQALWMKEQSPEAQKKLALTKRELLDFVTFALSPESDGINGKFVASLWDPFRDLETYKQPGAYLLRRGVPKAVVKSESEPANLVSK